MADSRPVRQLEVSLPQEDFQWLAGHARQKNVSTAALASHAVWLLRMWEDTIKDGIHEVLDGIDGLRREHDQELRRLRDDCEGRLATPARAGPAPLYGARIAKLLDLAVSTSSEGEAEAAFAKARTLHHRPH